MDEPGFDGMNQRDGTRGATERWIALGAIGLLAFGCLLILWPFISSALWAAILCFTTWPLFIRLDAQLHGRRGLAASIATLLLTAIIVVPMVILVSRISGSVSEVISATTKMLREGPPPAPAWVASIPLAGPSLASHWNLFSESSTDRVAAVAKWLPSAKDAVLGSGRALGQGVFQIILSLLMVFVFYSNGEEAARRLDATMHRIGGAEGTRLLEIAGTTIRAVVYGVLGTALLQGVLAGVGFMLAGVPGAVLLGFVTFVVAAIPGGPLLVGAIPILWLYRGGSIEWAIFLAVWIIVVGNLDNVVRPFLISLGGGDIPLLLVVLGVLGGAMSFGLIGLFLGPTLLAVGYAIFEEWSSKPSAH